MSTYNARVIGNVSRQGTRKVHTRASLNPRQLHTLETRQFEDLSPKYKSWHRSQTKFIDAIYEAQAAFDEKQIDSNFINPLGLARETFGELDKVATNKNNITLTLKELSTLFDPKKPDLKPRATTEVNVLDQYVEMIVNYVNNTRARPALWKQSFRHCYAVPSQAFDNLVYGNVPHSARDDYNLEAYARDVLYVAGIRSQEDFYNADFILIPWLREEAHVMLVGVAPKQKFAFVVDAQNTRHTNRDEAFAGLRTLLHTVAPDIQWAAFNEGAKMGEWRLYGQWSYRSQNIDDSPHGGQQAGIDRINCGIFTATHAFNLAFGFSCDSFQTGDLVESKKPRMAAEFTNGGFVGPNFNYDMVQYPRIAGASGKVPPMSDADKKRWKDSGNSEEILRSSSRAASASDHATDAGDRGRSSSLARAASRTRELWGKLKTSVRKNRDSSDDEASQRGLDDDSEAEGSDGESDDEADLGFKKKPLYTRNHLSYLLSKTNDGRLKGMDVVPYPEQFDSKKHQQAMLIYDVPNEFHLQDRQYSKRELKQVCRDFKLANWKKWSHERQGFFQKYVMSECGGVIAKAKNYTVQPAPGIGKQHAGAKNYALIKIQEQERQSRKRQRLEYESGSESGDSSRTR